MSDAIDLEALRVPEADPSDCFTIRDFIEVSGLLLELSIDPETQEPRDIPGLIFEVIETEAPKSQQAAPGSHNTLFMITDQATDARLSMTFKNRTLAAALEEPIPDGFVAVGFRGMGKERFNSLSIYELHQVGITELREENEPDSFRSAWFEMSGKSGPLPTGPWYLDKDLSDLTPFIQPEIFETYSRAFGVILDHFPVEEIRQLAYAEQLNQLAEADKA